MLEKILYKVAKKRDTIAKWVALFLAPYSAAYFLSIITRTHYEPSALLSTLKTALPAFAYFGIRIVGITVQAYTTQHPMQQRTRIGDRKIIRGLERKLMEIEPPEMGIRELKEVKMGFMDALGSAFTQGNTAENLGRILSKNKNPNAQISLAIKRLVKENPDAAFTLLSKTLTSEVVPRHTLPALIIKYSEQLALFWYRKLALRDMQGYLLSALYSSLYTPKHTWYYSALGCMVADRFDTPFRKEMHVFHALLATAQIRSDQKEAWGAAVKVMREEPVWERMGETRTVVRRLHNTKFFAESFVFKESEALESLVQEKELYRQLSETVSTVNVPEVLHITEEPLESRHCLVMRYLSGDTLYSRLQNGNLDDVDRVIPVLADIHANFRPAGLSAVSLEDKLRAKFADLSAPEETTDLFFRNFSPIEESLNSVPWYWTKDAHPENWIIGERVGVLDCEGVASAPCTFDLANLLEYDDFFTKEQIEQKIGTYFNELESHGISVGREVSLQAYYNAVIYRMICLAGAWSSRPAMIPKRARAISRACSAVNNLRESCAIYANYHTEYGHIAIVLDQLGNLIDSYVS